jgi:serine protease
MSRPALSFALLAAVLVFTQEHTPAFAQPSAGDQPGNPPELKLQNVWPHLQRGANGLVPRYVPPKEPSIELNPARHFAGLFTLKFAEGTHIRWKSGKLFFDRDHVTLENDELNRLRRLGLTPDEVDRQLWSVNEVLRRYRRDYGFEILPLFASRQYEDPDGQFIEKAMLEQRAAEELADLDLYYVAYAKAFDQIDVQQAMMNELGKSRIVEHVQPATLTEPPQGASTPDISGQQGYLTPAPIGLDSIYARSRPGGSGDGIRVIDVEFDWVTDHEDFPPADNLFWGGRPACAYDGGGSNHGTAVLGVIAAPDNGLGITGMAPNVSYGLSSVCRLFDFLWGSVVSTFSGEQWAGRNHNVAVANAIDLTLNDLRFGDVLLIEQHAFGPDAGPCTGCNCGQWGYVPMEYYQESFDIIRRATARGIIVVEAAGNGGQTLDGSRYRSRFATNIRNSHAILVGASSMGDRMPICDTNVSQRIDVHAWGTGVVTLGYKRGLVPPFTNEAINRYYTNNFGGTSSASAILAGAVASLQGARRAADLPALSNREVRNLFVNTGSPQLGTIAQIEARPIGPQPDLRAAIDAATGAPADAISPGLYTIEVKSTRKVLDIDISWFRGQDDGQALVQHDSHGGSNQQFQVMPLGGGFYRIIALHSGKPLTVEGAGSGNGALLFQSSWLSGSAGNQDFRIERVGTHFRIVARHSGKALEVTGDSHDNGARIQQFDFHGGDNQLFSFIQLLDTMD